MTIFDKTRKILWARSGNKCAICRHALVVSATSADNEAIVGDECHIVSGRQNGPRFDPTYGQEKLDSYENLILLCRIHHKMVDDQAETYSAVILRQMKTNHENWTAEKLNQSPDPKPVKIERIKENIPAFLNRLTMGPDILNIVDGCCASSFTHDELHNQEEVDLVGEFLEVISDWIDIGLELGPADRVRVAFDLSQNIKNLEEGGFYVFGAREIQRIKDGHGNPSDWPVAWIRVIRKDNEEIICVSSEEIRKETRDQQQNAGTGSSLET